jgi:hypothetical protein
MRHICYVCGQPETRNHERVDNGSITECINHKKVKKTYTSGQILDAIFPKGQYNSQTRRIYLDRPEKAVKKDMRAFARFNGLEMEA